MTGKYSTEGTTVHAKAGMNSIAWQKYSIKSTAIHTYTQERTAQLGRRFSLLGVKNTAQKARLLMHRQKRTAKSDRNDPALPSKHNPDRNSYLEVHGQGQDRLAEVFLY